MELRQLKIFLVVASKLNFTRAAEELHLSQSSVSEQIQNLEDNLQVKLFDRSQRQLKLTDAGARLVEYAQRLLRLADEAQASVHTAAELAFGKLSIGALETICVARLPTMLTAYTTAHPSISVHVKTANTRELLQQVGDDALDVCLLLGERQLEKNLHSEIIFREELVVLLPVNHPLAHNGEIRLEDLTQETFLVTETGCVYRDMFEKAFASQPNRPRLAGEIGSIATLKNLVETGAGCALLPRFVTQSNDGKSVAVTCKGLTTTDVPISMVWRRRDVQPPRLVLLLELIRNNFAHIKPDDDHHRHATQSR